MSATAIARHSSHTFTARSRRNTSIKCSTLNMSFATLSSRRPQFYRYLSDVDPNEQSYRDSFNRSAIYPFDYFNSAHHYYDDGCMIRIDPPLKESISSPTSCMTQLDKVAEAITATATATTCSTVTDPYTPTIDSGTIITDTPFLPKKQDGPHTFAIASISFIYKINTVTR
ncbi:unnamed protein product [Absidia cylindrospora]